jgi:hypothetical protein
VYTRQRSLIRRIIGDKLSDEVRVIGKFGRVPNDPSKPRLFLGPQHLKATPPDAVNFYSSIGGGGMLGNDQYGDCVFAANGHIVEQQTALGQGKEVPVTTQQALAEYSKVTGFDPNDPSTDNGAMVQDGLNDLRKSGLAGHKIAAFAEISVSDMNTVKNAVAEFGVVDIGFNVPASAMNQFNAGQPWDVVSHDGGIEGGHCVIVCGYDSKYLYVYTWNAVQKMTYAFWNKYVEEAWAPISQDWVNASTGLDPDKVDMSDLGAQFVALFPGQPNPFPNPSPVPPTPPPNPTPPPGPVPPTPKPSWWDEFIQWLTHLFD